MNLREGVKRVYLVFSCLVIAGTLLANGVSPPSDSTVDSETAWELMKHAETLPWNRAAGRDAFQLRHNEYKGFSDQGLVKMLCSSTSGAPNLHQQALCEVGEASKNRLLLRQAKHYLGALLMGLIAAAVCFALWLLFDWIARGFAAPRHS